jgi:hypothetical protein
VTFSSGSPRAGQSWWQDALQHRLAPLQLLAAQLAETPERLPLPLRDRAHADIAPAEEADRALVVEG